MRNHILDRLALLADYLIATTDQEVRTNIAEAAMAIAVAHYFNFPSAKGSP